MNIALTGITGMVGSHLIKELVKEDTDGNRHNIRALIREISVVEHLKSYEDVDYIIGDVDDKYDGIYEKTRRELVEEGYLPPSDWDLLYDDIKESDEELENWRAWGLEEEEYEGEITFYFEPDRQIPVPLGIKFPKEIGNTLYAVEKIFKGHGRVQNRQQRHSLGG